MHWKLFFTIVAAAVTAALIFRWLWPLVCRPLASAHSRLPKDESRTRDQVKAGVPQQSVVFLDILGFKAYTGIDTVAAAQLLLDYNNAINTKLADMAQFPGAAYLDQGLRQLAQAGEVGSFEVFLPCSDSAFIISNQPDLLVRQVSRFLIDSFAFTSDAFAHPENEADPTTVTIAEISPVGIRRRFQERWFPLLFRGGIAYGDVLTLQVTGIGQNGRMNTTNLAGTAVVNAVGLEKTGKGPRLFSRADFYEQLNAESRALFAQISADCYELLWPMLLYHDPNSPDADINHFSDLFLPAANLYQVFRRNADVEPHYREFLKLIIRATTRHFERHNWLESAQVHIRGRIAAYGLGEMEANLLAEAQV